MLNRILTQSATRIHGNTPLWLAAAKSKARSISRYLQFIKLCLSDQFGKAVHIELIIWGNIMTKYWG